MIDTLKKTKIKIVNMDPFMLTIFLDIKNLNKFFVLDLQYKR